MTNIENFKDYNEASDEEKLEIIRDDVYRALTQMADLENGIVELRAFMPGGFWVSGFYDDLEKLAADAARLDVKEKAIGVYNTLNPVRRELLSRSPNKYRRVGKGGAVTDGDIAHRSLLLVDCDPVRPTHTNSTKEERLAAWDRADKVDTWLGGQGVPAPIFGSSGNGGHLLYRVDLPNDEESRELVKRVLTTLSDRFSDEKVKIDVSVSNASRIVRLYGTTNRKGTNTPERPQMKSAILDGNREEEAGLVSASLLRGILPKEPEKKEKQVHKLRAVRSDSTFLTHEQRHTELVRRVMAHPTAAFNSRGIFDCQGICHNGTGNTALMFDPATGAVYCNKECGYFVILRAFGLPDERLPSSKSSNSQNHKHDGDDKMIAASPTLDRQKALYGLAGDIVKAIEPHSESDPVAILVQLLVGFGNAIGRSAYFTVEADYHYTNLFTVIVGASARGRKGTSWGHVKRLLEAVEPDWANNNITGGLTSGEGLIHHVRDEGQNFMPGAARQSKRALVIESEFASVLRVQKREGNTLSAIIRQAWDTGDIRVMRRNEPEKATNAHISVIGHITDDELRKCLHQTDEVNGYANRFLWVCAKRSKKLPEGGSFHRDNVAPLVIRLKEALEAARGVSEMKRDEWARELWIEIYDGLDAYADGRLDGILSRAESQIMRLACIYALLDCSKVVRRVHLEAAKAVWDYCVTSAKYIFGRSLTKKAQKFLDALNEAGTEGLKKTDLYRKNGGRSDGVNEALEELKQASYAFSKSIPTEGRAEERWFVAVGNDLLINESDDFDEESSDDEINKSSDSSIAQRPSLELVDTTPDSEETLPPIVAGRVENLFDPERINQAA